MTQPNSSLANDASDDAPALGSTAAERTTQARMAAYTSWSNTTDRAARTSKARKAFRDKFLDQVDPERKLPEAVRAQRADAAFKAHMAALNLKAMKARRLKRAS